MAGSNGTATRATSIESSVIIDSKLTDLATLSDCKLWFINCKSKSKNKSANSKLMYEWLREQKNGESEKKN